VASPSAQRESGADALDNTVSWFDRDTLRRIRTIGIGASAYAVATGAGRVWVATASNNTVVELDARNGGILDTILLPDDVNPASAWAVTFGAGAVWVTSGRRLLRIDARTGSVAGGDVGTPCCTSPTGVAAAANSIWVADGTQLRRISAATGMLTGAIERDVAFDGVAYGYRRIWVTSTHEQQQDPGVFAVHPKGLFASETRFPHPVYGLHTALSMAAGAGGIWTADYGEGKVIRVDPRTGEVVARIPVGGHPWGIAVEDGRAFVSVD